MDESGLTIQVCRTPEEMRNAADAEKIIVDALGNNIRKKIGNVELGRQIKILLRNRKDEVVGGLIANIFGGWVYISFLWIEDNLRDKGYGSQLVGLCETEALKMGCEYAHLDTYSFEARPFYERLGYELFATLEDYPKGYNKYFLKKRLLES